MPNTWCPRLRRRRRPLPRSRAFLMPISASNCVRPSTAQITKACAASGQPAGLNPISPLIELDQSEHPIRMAILRLESRNSRRVGSSSRGTEGSNPSPSSGESAANLTSSGSFWRRSAMRIGAALDRCPVSLSGDRGFESCSLQRRVYCKPDFLDRGAEKTISTKRCRPRSVDLVVLHRDLGFPTSPMVRARPE
jgi:hypothetical protein